MRTIQSDEIKLAALPVPAGIDPSMATAIQTSIERAFVFAFRLIMLVCAGLSVLSAAFAWRMIANRPVSLPSTSADFLESEGRLPKEAPGNVPI